MATSPIGRVERDRNAEGRPENARPRDRFGAPLPRGANDELSDRVDPAEVVGSPAEALSTAVGLFNDQRFFEAHEFLEYAWKSPDVEPADRDFWKGVTQVAVGCTHVQRGNAKGAITLLERAAGHLQPYPPRHHGVDVEGLRASAARVAQHVRTGGAAADAPFFRFPLA